MGVALDDCLVCVGVVFCAFFVFFNLVLSCVICLEELLGLSVKMCVGRLKG